MTLRFFAVLILAVTVHVQVWAKVEVYVSYTDNETSGVLKTIASNPQGQTVLAVGLNTIDQETIFGQWHDYYKSDKPVLAKSGFFTAKTPESQVKKSLSQSLVTEIKEGGALEDSIMARTRTLSLGKSEFQVANLTPGKGNPKDLVLVIQSPEYGRQPVLLKRYLQAIFNSISSLPQAAAANGGIHLSTFGTSGGVSQKFRPGSATDSKASLFVGVEIVPGPPPRYRGRIAVAGLGMDTLEIDKTIDMDSPEKAQAEIIQRFLKLANSLSELSDEAADCKTPEAAFKVLQLGKSKPFLAHAIRKIMQDNQGSLSVSFFGGHDVKDAAARLGMTNVNMEDFHMFEALRGLPPAAELKSVDVRRVISDPHHIPEGAKTGIRTWLQNTTYTKDDYLDAILWGLGGAPFASAPEKSRWSAMASLPKDVQRELVPMHKLSGAEAHLDPFYYGIARNYLATVSDPDLLKLVIRPPETLSESDQIALVTPFAERMKKKVDRLYTDYGKLSVQQRRDRVAEILEDTKTFKGKYKGSAWETPFLTALPDGRYPILNVTPDVFVRTSFTTAAEVGKLIKPDDFDRPFYKMSLVGMDERTKKFIEDRRREINPPK